MDQDEIEDSGVPLDSLSESDTIKKTEGRLRQLGNMVGSFLELKRTVC